MKDIILFYNYLLTRHTGERLSQAFIEKGYDYRPEHFLILLLLDLRGPMSQQAICTGAIKGKSTISRAIDFLEKRGVVKRFPGEDAREKHVKITDKGKAEFEELKTVAMSLEARMLSPLSPAQQNEFLKLLKICISGSGKKF